MKELFRQKCVGNEYPQLLINGIQKIIWKTNTYKVYCFKNLSLKRRILKHTSPGSHPEKGTNPRYTSQVITSMKIQDKVDISKINFEDKVVLKGGGNVT